jgi:uncharacterized protein
MGEALSQDFNEARWMTEQEKTELEAAAFRRLVQHLRDRTDVQNIDMMNLAGFCRNCLSNWMVDAAKARSLALNKDEAREEIYGMSYEAWKALYQKEATVAVTPKHSH